MKLKISVGPAPLHWGVGKLKSLYRELAQAPVDYVYVGETACPSRACFPHDFVSQICNELTTAGTEVYASSPILVREEKQRRTFGRLAELTGRIEINSSAFLESARFYAATAGGSLNVYNSVVANILAEHMVNRVVLPCELNMKSIGSIAGRCDVAIEVVVHGHIPVGISATCLTTRSLGDGGCEKLCQSYPEGMVLEASDRPLFRIEGLQTLSAASCCLVEYLEQLEEAGVDTVRILPQWNHTARIVRIYRDVLDHRRPCREAMAELKSLSSAGLCNGWFLGKAGWIYESPN